MPKIFKAGNYGAKGNYTVENLKSWIGKEFSITAGHIGDWQKNGYPITAIPVAGTCKVTDVDENGYLIGEFNYNSFGESIKEQYPNLSIGIGSDGNPNHLAILGYAPPHLKDLDKSFSEFSQDLTSLETTQTIEFAEDDQAKIDEFTSYIKGVDASKIKLGNLFDVLWEKDSERVAVDKLKAAGYTVEKTAEFSKETLGNIANILGYILAEKPVENLTQAEMYEKVRAEFTRDSEKKEVKEKFIKMFPPVMHSFIEFGIDKAFDEKEYSNMIEFSEGKKGTIANMLKEFSKEDGPFAHLFKNISSGIEFSEDKDPVQEAKELAESF
ncbi:hypothetical protein [Fusobacterium mortiferum]|uniref:hypothetical protein n=1 Tax=Fusobacterium mortiferum TaxID=850 RepID=UPI000E43B75B|nr:hypothetical protein [Fusobacterium mortiferum]RGN00766.1 hypothetical protein DXB84_02480 [Fusobacterium mortiferum]